MQLTLRSQLIAGVAALGVSAIAVAPVVQPELLSAPERVSSALNLTNFGSPIAALVSTVDDIVVNLTTQNPVPAPDELYWPDSFYTSDFSFLFAPDYWGAVPDFVNQFSTGGLSALISNLSGYVNAASYGLSSLVIGPTSAIWNTPFALITAAGYLAAGQADLALAELQAQIIDPIVQSVTDVIQAVGYIVDNAITNSATIIANTIPGLLSNMITTLVNGTGFVAQAAVDTLGAAVTSLLAGQFEDAWNGVIDGLLGPNGTLGQIENLVVGVGIIQPVEYEEGVVDTVVIPSLRSNLTSAAQRLGDLSSYEEGGIRNDAFYPEEAQSAAAVATADAAAARAATAPATQAASDAESAAADTATGAASESADAATSVEVTHPVAGGQTAEADASAAAPAADAGSAESGAAAANAGGGTAVEKPAASVKGKAKVTRSARGGAEG